MLLRSSALKHAQASLRVASSEWEISGNFGCGVWGRAGFNEGGTSVVIEFTSKAAIFSRGN